MSEIHQVGTGSRWQEDELDLAISSHMKGGWVGHGDLTADLREIPL